MQASATENHALSKRPGTPQLMGRRLGEDTAPWPQERKEVSLSRAWSQIKLTDSNGQQGKSMSKFLSSRLLITAILATSLCACASARSTKEIKEIAMTSAGVSTTTPKPFTAESLLRSILGLVKNTSSVRDISVDDLAAAVEAPATSFGAEKFGYSGDITAQWGYALVLRNAGNPHARLDLEFLDGSPRRDTPAMDICSLDFEHVASELDAAGFKREQVYGEHGRVMYDRFYRPGISVEVDSTGRSATPSSNGHRFCVLALRVK